MFIAVSLYISFTTHLRSWNYPFFLSQTTRTVGTTAHLFIMRMFPAFSPLFFFVTHLHSGNPRPFSHNEDVSCVFTPFLFRNPPAQLKLSIFCFTNCLRNRNTLNINLEKARASIFNAVMVYIIGYVIGICLYLIGSVAHRNTTTRTLQHGDVVTAVAKSNRIFGSNA